jgi:hypothetical protein
MTSDGSPYSRFRRALRSGNLFLIQAAAADLPQVDLADALAICLLMGDQADVRFDRAATRWLARLVCERPAVGLEDLRTALTALEALPHNPLAARQVLAEICRRHDLRRVLRLLLGTDGRAVT